MSIIIYVVDYILIFFVRVVLLCAVLWNFMTFIVVQKNRKGRNVTSILIFDLSVSDIVMRVDIFF